eukprot:TRINITY_DN2562_c0_g1_i4.p1 TRINITY_DN2562_c0_g1~~TRINITY_DN2562_c0_g1_i4.p1  ORF type:complete len:558 (+),score=91.26 TRINITY_DN2562_c0_g1_i4:65-1738(+)
MTRAALCFAALCAQLVSPILAVDSELTQLFHKKGPLGIGLELKTVGEYVYELRNTAQVFIYKVTDGRNPQEVGMLRHPLWNTQYEEYIAMEICNGLMYLQRSNEVLAYSLADPTDPVLVGTLKFPDQCIRHRWLSMSQSSTHFFLPCFTKTDFPARHHGITRFMVIEKGPNMKEVGVLNIPGIGHYKNSVYREKDKRVYACVSMREFNAIDVSDPTNPNVVLTSPTGATERDWFLQMELVIHDDHIYASGDMSRHNFNLMKIDPNTLQRIPLNVPDIMKDGKKTVCGSLSWHGGRLYLACYDNGIVVLEEPTPNTFVLVNHHTTIPAVLKADRDFLFTSGMNDEGFRIFRVVPEKFVELVGGVDPVVKDVGTDGSVEETTSGQKWVEIPSWLHGSTAHMGSHGGKGMSLKLVCPSNTNNHPCTFYVALHNCLPCSSAVNGGLPNGLVTAGFEAGGCGPKYVPTFSGAPVDENPQPAAIFKLEVEAGAAPVEIPVVRKLLHFAVFVHSTGQQCSLLNKASCAITQHCRLGSKMCMGDPMCSKTGPLQVGSGRRCSCTF